MELQSIKDKIKKLLTLSEGSNFDEESQTALLKAQELMVKYKLEQKDIEDDQKESKVVQKKTVLCYSTRSSDHYMNDLASVISENFCCVNYVSTTKGTSTHYICFMGDEDDVEIATESLYVANQAIVKGYNKIYKEVCKENNISYLPAKYFNPLKVGYTEGYIKGLKEALQAQKEANAEWGLVLVVPQEAKDFMSDLEGVDFRTMNAIRQSNRYYDQGYDDGKEFKLRDKIDTHGEQEKIGG